jgi:RNA polymerase sigma factor for flagellar operon FliA
VLPGGLEDLPARARDGRAHRQARGRGADLVWGVHPRGTREPGDGTSWPNTGIVLTAEQQELAARYADLAESQAWAFAVKTAGRMSVDDARSAALFGLCQAIDAFPGYCERNSFDPSREDYQRAYLLKRIRGAILDDARAADHMTRTDRKRAKALRQAEDDGRRGDGELAAAAGLSIGETRRVQADALLPVSLDDHLEGGAANYGGALCDESAGTEEQVTVRETLAAAVQAMDSLPAVQRVLLALRFHQELPLDVAAKSVHLEPAEARRQLEAAVCEIHNALLRQVQDEGTGPRRPAPPRSA